MTRLSVGTELAWRVAGIEAQEVGAPTIGVDLLLVGLLSLEKLLDPASPVSAGEREQVRAEHRALATVLSDCDLDAATLRRAVRPHRAGGTQIGQTIRHRDAAARAAFERADVLAAQHGS